MALNQRPFWTGGSPVIEDLMTTGDSNEVALDLTEKRGAWVYIMIGRVDTTAVSGDMVVSVRPKLSAGAVNYPESPHTRIMNTVTADGSSTIDVTVAIGDRVIPIAATTNFALNDLIYIGAAAGTRGEFAKVIVINAGVSLVVDKGVQFEHTSGQADLVINKADVFSRMWVGGGSEMSVEANYPTLVTAPDIFVQVFVETYDGDGTP